MMRPGRLSGARVLITGASSGIGLEAAHMFAAEGARLALLARGQGALEQVAADVRADALVLAADVTDRDALDDAVARAVAHLGGLDVVVTNAAVGAFGHFLQIDADEFDRVVDITFRGAVNLVRATLPHLRESSGTIVATLSLLSRVPMPSWSSYAAAKHALRGFLNSISVEEREQRTGVRIAMVHPGVVDTQFWAYASSATGRKPRVPPEAYRARVVARALVESAVRPRPELVLGGETLAFDRVYLLWRGLGERLLVGFDRWLHSGRERALDPGALWEPTGSTQVSAGIPARESALAAAQTGSRPRGRALLQLARRLGALARTGLALRKALSRPLPEGRPSDAEPSRPQAASPREPAST